MNIGAMTYRPAPDLPALAAQLRLAALTLVVKLAEWLGAGRLAAVLRRRMARDIARLERFATGLVVLAAVQSLPRLPAKAPGCRRPPGAPPGFARVAARDNAMRAMQRRLFPRARDLKLRLKRLDSVLAALDAAAAGLVRHIARIPPASRLLAIAPPADGLPARTGADAVAFDTS